MGNVISYKDKDILCSNGCTDVLLTIIGLSGSRIAQYDYEKELIVWLMTKDQSRVGIGTVGFDICEMPWIAEHFDEQKKFMINAIDGALTGVGYDTLDYEPNMEIIGDRLNELREFFEQIQPEDIDTAAVNEWFEETEADDPVNRGYPKCEKHGIYLSVHGCMACNDEYV